MTTAQSQMYNKIDQFRDSVIKFWQDLFNGTSKSKLGLILSQNFNLVEFKNIQLLKTKPTESSKNYLWIKVTRWVREQLSLTDTPVDVVPDKGPTDLYTYSCKRDTSIQLEFHASSLELAHTFAELLIFMYEIMMVYKEELVWDAVTDHHEKEAGLELKITPAGDISPDITEEEREGEGENIDFDNIVTYTMEFTIDFNRGWVMPNALIKELNEMTKAAIDTKFKDIRLLNLPNINLLVDTIATITMTVGDSDTFIFDESGFGVENFRVSNPKIFKVYEDVGEIKIQALTIGRATLTIYSQGLKNQPKDIAIKVL